jgi:HK97 family phage prohead protease
MQIKTEQRSLPSLDGLETEIRAGKEFSGYAAVYYDGTPKTEYLLGGQIIERVHRGAFDDVLAGGNDMFALYHHREDMILGRRSSGSLSVESTDRGLRYSVPVDPTDPIHQTVAARIRRGDVRGSSVTWQVPPNGQSFEKRSDGSIIRNIRRVAAVFDVGPTHIPAYTATSAELRSELTAEQIELLTRTAHQSLLEPPTPVEIWQLLRKNHA